MLIFGGCNGKKRLLCNCISNFEMIEQLAMDTDNTRDEEEKGET